MAYATDTTTLLTELANSLREAYRDGGLLSEQHRFGMVINQLIRPSASRKFQGKDIYWQVKDANARPTRIDRVGNIAGTDGQAYSTQKLKATFNDRTAASNDFSVIRSSAAVSVYDLERQEDSDAFIENVLPTLIRDGEEDAEEKLALARNLPATGLIGTISNVTKQNDSYTYAGATATPDETSGVRFIVTDGQVAALQPGQLIDVYEAGGDKRFTTICSDMNVSDRSVGLDGWNTTTKRRDTAINISAIVITDELYIVGMKGGGMISVAEWFSTPTASESFFTKDRTLPVNQYLRPLIQGPASLQGFDMGHFNSLGVNAMHLIPRGDMANGYICTTTPEIAQAVTDIVDEKIWVSHPSSSQAPYQAALGFSSMPILHHAHLGAVSLNADPFAQLNRMRVLRTGDWESLVYRDFKPLPRATAMGGFYDVMDSSTGKGTLEYRIDYHGVLVDICTMPKRQFEINNILGVAV